MKIAVRKADKLYSLLIRHRAGNQCERCGRTEGQLHCSHHVPRGVKALRFDPVNAACLCFQCHAWWHSNPAESGPWLVELIGQTKFSYLLRRANEPFKFDKAMQAHITKRLEQIWHIASTSGLREFPSPYPAPGELPDPLVKRPRKAKKAKAAAKRKWPKRAFPKPQRPLRAA
jgi:hypothetical protein